MHKISVENRVKLISIAITIKYTSYSVGKYFLFHAYSAIRIFFSFGQYLYHFNAPTHIDIRFENKNSQKHTYTMMFENE